MTEGVYLCRTKFFFYLFFVHFSLQYNLDTAFYIKMPFSLVNIPYIRIERLSWSSTWKMFFQRLKLLLLFWQKERVTDTDRCLTNDLPFVLCCDAAFACRYTANDFVVISTTFLCIKFQAIHCKIEIVSTLFFSCVLLLTVFHL